MRRAFVLGRTLCVVLCLGLLGVAATPAQAAGGPLLAYLVPRGDTQAVVLRRAGGSLYAEITLPPNFNPQSHSAFSPNGRWLAYHTGRISLPPDSPTSSLQLHLFDANGQQPSLGLPARGTDPLLLATEQGLYRYEPDGYMSGGALTQVGGEAPAGVSVSHTNPDELWGIHGDTVVKSEDGGATWGAAGSELLSSKLLAPLIMAPPNNNPQFVQGYGLAPPGVQLWRGAANGFWTQLPGLPVLPLGLANDFGLAWDADNRLLYLGGPNGELYTVQNADAPDENAPAAALVHDFDAQDAGMQNLDGEGRAVPLAVGQGPTLYVMLYGPFEPRFLRGVWDGTTWSWQALRLPMDAAG